MNRIVHAIACLTPFCAPALAQPQGCRSWQPSGNVIPVSPGVNLQGTINQAAAGSIVQLASGTYIVSSTIQMKSGVSVQGLPGAVVSFNGNGGYNAFHAGTGTSGLSIWGITFDGQSAGIENNSPGICAGVFIEHTSSINVISNTFQNIFNCSAIFMYDSDNIYLQSNMLINNVQGISGVYDDRRTTHHSFWISDNTINSFYRMGVEVAAYWTRDFHTDRNMITWSKGGIGLSIVTGGGQPVQDTSRANGTIMGNIENSVSGSGGWGIELAVPNLNVENNTMTNVDHPIVVSSSPNAVIVNNIVSGASGISSEDGGYESNFWVGSNTLNGQNIIGWSGHGLTSQPETSYAPSIPACAAR